MLLLFLGHELFTDLNKSLAVPDKQYSLIFNQKPETFDTFTLQKIFDRIPFASAGQKDFTLKTGGCAYQVESSLDTELQEFIIDHIDRKNSKNFGFVAIDPTTGRILSMVSYDKNSTNSNVCITPNFPSASLFKIITAAAAIDKCGFNCNTPVTFNDSKYTLYKRQLKDRINKYTNRMTFAESFAESVNPVFGKIGKNRLGKATIEKYAEAFGFNKNFDFEIPLKPSIVSVEDNPYNWAEVASGFNNDTRISPLHGALMVSGIVNQGKLLEPTIIDEIDKNDQAIYTRTTREASDIISPDTAQTLKKLMRETIISGTASKSFGRVSRDKILSRLNIGGKTGSINNNAEHLKYDWFTGFAEEKDGSKKIVVTVLVVHQDFIGTRAARYSRMAIKEYFKNYYANIDSKKDASSASL